MSRVALITGATGGIGRATALALVQAGWQVYGTSRDPSAAKPIPGVTLLALDLNDSDSIAGWVDLVWRQAGRIDALISNAGLLGPAAAVEELRLEQARAIMETNFFGVFALTNALLPRMIAAGGGRLVYISSTGGRVAAIPFFSLYTASKHALEAYAEGLRREVQDFGVQVTLVEPGYTQTGMMDDLEPPSDPLPRYDPARERLLALERYGLRYGTPPQAVARAICHVLDARRPPLHLPVGSDSRWMIALARLLPQRLLELLLRVMFFRWRPARFTRPVPTHRQLGPRAILFHGPTRERVLRAGYAALLIGVLASAMAWLRRAARRGRRSE